LAWTAPAVLAVEESPELDCQRFLAGPLRAFEEEGTGDAPALEHLVEQRFEPRLSKVADSHPVPLSSRRAPIHSRRGPRIRCRARLTTPRLAPRATGTRSGTSSDRSPSRATAGGSSLDSALAEPPVTSFGLPECCGEGGSSLWGNVSHCSEMHCTRTALDMRRRDASAFSNPALPPLRSGLGMPCDELFRAEAATGACHGARHERSIRIRRSGVEGERVDERRPGTLYVFQSDGKLLVTSPVLRQRLAVGRWRTAH
jgi:hypothetical protein